MEHENLSGLPTEQEYLEMVRDLEIDKILGSFDEDFEKFVASHGGAENDTE